ncbi:MAG: adenylate/guanylate cyclase domain-containing protein [Planctomycetota bacterium]|jgi:class 3 adenylate cyclase
MASRVLTVMFTDIKGFTERTSKSSREELDHILKKHEDLLMPMIPAFSGRLVKTVGDALMIVFDSPTNAVLCGIMMQERLREHNEALPEKERIEVRVAINTGEMLERDGDVFGEAVNIAARIEGITEASEIYFTERVYLAMNKAEVPSSELGLRRLKGVPEPIKIYRVIQDRLTDEYQQLLERLRSSNFEDVPVPTAGSTPLASPAVRPTSSKAPLLAVAGVVVVGAVFVALIAGGIIPMGRSDGGGDTPATGPKAPESEKADPVLEAAAKVEDALKTAELGLALARADAMLKAFPDRKESHDALKSVVEAEVRELTGKELFPDALKRIEERRKAQNYLKFEELEREVLLGHAALYVGRGDLGRATDVYVKLFRSRPTDLEAHKLMARDLGGSGHGSIQGLAEEAAKRVAKLSQGPIGEPVAVALLGSLKRHDPYRPQATESRKILAERYPGAAEAARTILYSDHRYTRMNAFLLLEATGKITAEEELVVHFKNVLVLRATGGSDRQDLDKSLEYIEGESAKPDWAARKGALSLDSIVKVQALRSRNETSERVFRLLAKAFYPEIRPSIERWLQDKDLVVRHGAFQVTKLTPMMERFDVWAYHAGNLMLDDYKFRYTVFREAVQYFASMAKTNRAGDAKQILTMAGDKMKKDLETRRDYTAKHWRENFDFNVRELEQALKTLE